ncbi:hypothetical protein M3Y94_00976700 [Aphelenchoides besseyi]|nr:hypothetical protein M3Y94_00976700 [Aphelenchoides besseyi]
MRILCIVLALVITPTTDAVACHDYCTDVIGCNQDQQRCEGRYCTFYHYRNLRNTQQVSIKRSCTNSTWFTYGPQQTRFGLNNRCQRVVNGDDEWLLGMCDKRNFCNYICDTNVNDFTSNLHTSISLLLFSFLMSCR